MKFDRTSIFAVMPDQCRLKVRDLFRGVFRPFILLGLLAGVSGMANAQTTYCAGSPAVDASGTFTPFASHEGLEVRGGNVGTADWEWALGVDTHNHWHSVTIDNIDWTSGTPLKFTLVYDGDGGGTIAIFDNATNARLATRDFAQAPGLRIGNAIKLYVSTSAGLTTSVTAANITAINGVAVDGGGIVTAGNDQFSDAALVYALADPAGVAALTIEGTVTLTWPGHASAMPTGSQLSMTINAGNVTCAPPQLLPQYITFENPGTRVVGNAFMPVAQSSTENQVRITTSTPDICSTDEGFISLLAPGLCTLTANIPGNDIFAPATPVTQSFDVIAPPPPSAHALTLAVGGSHACALINGGGVKCWGKNFSGQLGDGTGVDQLTPVDVLGLDTGAAAVEAGLAHTCVITPAGGVKCWGNNASGQLGDGTTTPRATPVDVIGLSSGVVGLATGASHSCALISGGEVKCWGDNQYGQLGDDTSANRLLPTGAFGLAAGVAQVRAGDVHTCAILANGGLKCWGRNADGQLGDGTLVSRPRATDVVSLSSGVLAVEGATSHSCVLIAGGGVQCWGSNASGQLGDGTTIQRLLPTNVSGLGTGNGAIAAAQTSTCALTGVGGVKCWGANAGSATPSDISGLAGGIVEIGIGGNFACVLTQNSAIQCWGDNTNGRLGDGTTISRGTPASVVGFAGSDLLNQSILFAPLADRPAGSPPFALSASSGSGLPVDFSSIVPGVCSVAGDIVTLIAAGACTIAARQSGDASYAAALIVTRTFRVTSTLSVQVISGFAPTTPIPFAANGAFALSATGGGSGNPLAFAATTPDVCSVAGTIASIVAAGTCTLTANQAGNAGYSAAPQVSATVIIAKANQTIQFAALADQAIGAAAFTLSAASSAGLAVAFVSDTIAVCTVSGTTVTLLATGTCTLRAGQPGNGNFNPAPQVLQSFTVTSGPAAQAITGFAPATPVAYLAGSTFALSATGGASGNPLVFSSATSGVCTVAGNVVTLIATGTCTLTADQAGNASYSAAPQATANVVVEPATLSPTAPRILTPLLPRAVLGQPYTATVIVAASPNVTIVIVGGLPTGLIATHNGSGTIAFTGTPTVAGDATLSLNATNSSGTVTLTAALSVDDFANNVVSLAAGRNHNCAVYNGGVRCWGANNNGQLGNNSTATSTAAVIALAAASGATLVAAGGDHSCAVVNGGVQCWGANDSGQLGNGTTTQSPIAVTAMTAGSGVAGVSAGASHSCAVVNGGVRCWGSNTSGQLGNASNTASLTPVIAIADGSGVSGIAAGFAHTCAVVNGGVRCWGNNSNQELGNGSSIASNIPVTTIAPGSGVTSISAGTTSGFGSSHTCMVIGGGVQCWGSNDGGKLGGFSSTNEIRYAIPAGSLVISVAAGGTHTCAVVAGGVKCWGSNNAGQNGDGTTQTQLSQSYVYAALPAGSNVTSVAAGAAHTCVVVNGGVQCWSDNANGRLGSVALPYRIARPQLLRPTASNVSMVTAGNDNTCAVQNGGLTCWGADYGSSVPNPNAAEVFQAGQNVTHAAAGANHLCAIVEGKVRCRGSNSSGQFGNNSTVFLDQPAALPVNARVSGLAAGGTHTCAVVEGGVQCWGGNASGQLGNNSTAQSLTPVAAIAAASNASAVSSHASHTCATVNGGVQCWGSNNSGQVGNGTTTNSLVPTSIIAAGGNAIAVAAGDQHTCAVINGGVRCWGSNANGQLGTGSTVTSLIPVQTIAAGSNATAIVAGASHTCALVNGGVQCWGANESGQLGNGSLVQSLTPVTAIPSGSNVIALAAGANHTCALQNGGALCWGSNAYGQLASLAINGPQKVYAALTSGAIVVPPPILPIVSITTPANNATVALGAVSIAIDAQAGAGTLTAIEIFDGATLLTSFSTPAVASFTFTYGWSGMAPGSHTLTAKATNSQGNTKTSAPITVQVLAPPSITLATLSNFYLAASSVDLNASVSAGAGATIAKVEFFANNGSSTTLVGTITSAPYNFRWPNVAAGSYTFTAKVTDSQGIAATSSAISVTVGANVTIQFAAGLNGSTVDGETTSVSGTLNAPPNSAVTINGQLATIAGGGQFFLNDVNLAIGANTVTATVTAPDGQTASQAIAMTRSAIAALFSVKVTPSGIAAPGTPFNADITIANPGTTPFAMITIVCSDPGPGADYAAVGTYQCVYPELGSYTVRVTVKNAGGGTIYSVAKQVSVKSAVEHIATVRAVYAMLTDRLKAGDKAAALNLFFSHAQTKYDEIFTALGANLALAAAQLGETAVITAGDEHAEIVVVRTFAGEQRSFLVYLMRGEDGVWRIEAM